MHCGDLAKIRSRELVFYSTFDDCSIDLYDLKYS